MKHCLWCRVPLKRGRYCSKDCKVSYLWNKKDPHKRKDSHSAWKWTYRGDNI